MHGPSADVDQVVAPAGDPVQIPATASARCQYLEAVGGSAATRRIGPWDFAPWSEASPANAAFEWQAENVWLRSRDLVVACPLKGRVRYLEYHLRSQRLHL